VTGSCFIETHLSAANSASLSEQCSIGDLSNVHSLGRYPWLLWLFGKAEWKVGDGLLYQWSILARKLAKEVAGTFRQRRRCQKTRQLEALLASLPLLLAWAC